MHRLNIWFEELPWSRLNSMRGREQLSEMITLWGLDWPPAPQCYFWPPNGRSWCPLLAMTFPNITLGWPTDTGLTARRKYHRETFTHRDTISVIIGNTFLSIHTFSLLQIIYKSCLSMEIWIRSKIALRWRDSRGHHLETDSITSSEKYFCNSVSII